MVLQSSHNPKLTSIKDVKSRQITIIGGCGRMGKLFREKLLAGGHKVNVLEQEDWDYADQLLNNADLVLVSVPIKYTVDVIQRTAKYLAPNTALCDITSIKTQPTEAMLRHHTGPVMGLHPMFGPSIKSFWEQKIVVCPGRNHESFQWLLDFLQSQGAELITCTPEEHDRMMVYIQATQHFCRLSLGVFLAQENIDLERSLSIASPSFRQEIEILKRLFCQTPNLCVDIMLATDERCQAINSLAHIHNYLANLIVQNDRATLVEEFEKAQTIFQKITN